jgi:predicted DNA-binding transcriptional regulator YafY
VDPAVLEAVSTATENRRILRFDYRDDLSRRVEPHAVVARAGRWYLVAWDLGAEDWRLFRLDRMVPRIPLGVQFVRRPIPHGDAVAFLEARARGSDSPERWPVYGELLLEVPLRAAAPWLADAEAVAVSDDACRIRVGSWSWAGVLSWVLRFDAPFTVLGPPEFAAAARSLAARVADAATVGR